MSLVKTGCWRVVLSVSLRIEFVSHYRLLSLSHRSSFCNVVIAIHKFISRLNVHAKDDSVNIEYF